MQRINLNHWFVRGNQLSISLLHFFVNINVYFDGNNVLFKLRVHNGKEGELLFDFDSLEKAISFTENVISNSNSYDNIQGIYNKYYQESKRLKKIKNN